MVSCGKHWPGIAGQVRLLTLQPSLFLCAQPNVPGLSVLVLQSWAEVLERVPRCNSGLLQSNLAPASSSQGHQPTETLPWRSNILASKCLETGGLFFFPPMCIWIHDGKTASPSLSPLTPCFFSEPPPVWSRLCDYQVGLHHTPERGKQSLVTHLGKKRPQWQILRLILKF